MSPNEGEANGTREVGVRDDPEAVKEPALEDQRFALVENQRFALQQ